MMKELKKSLELAFPALELAEHVPWRRVTTLGVGGEIPLMARPANAAALAALLAFCREEKVETLLLGGGANICGCDAPFAGLVIALSAADFKRIEHRDGKFHCGAGASLMALADLAADLGFGGVTALCGIPGTLGGALKMNAGAEGHSIGEFVLEVSGVAPDGSHWRGVTPGLEWGYRQSAVPEGVAITEAVLRFPAMEPVAARAEAAALRERRRAREPKMRSAGCAFRNAGGASAGRLIDLAGLKGRKVGGAMVSMEHANFVVNTGNATEYDYAALLGEIRGTVAEKFGVLLAPEVVFADKKSLEKVMKMGKSLKVLVLCGGNSSEREVSLRSGEAVAEALRRAGYEVVLQDIKECALTPEMRGCDVVFPALHGGFGESGELQKLLEKNEIKFVGCGSEASRTVMDKIATKKVFDACGISTAKWAVVTPENRAFPAELTLPVVVKTPRGGSSVGVKAIRRMSEWEAALDELFALDGEVLVEEFVTGVEISVPVVNGKVMPLVEIRPPNGFYDYDAKYIYKDGHTEYFCPAVSLSGESMAKAGEYTLKFFRAAGCKQLIRVDFIVDENGEPFALEGNSLPGFTATSLVPKSAQSIGVSFERLCGELVRAAAE